MNVLQKEKKASEIQITFPQFQKIRSQVHSKIYLIIVSIFCVLVF